MINLDELSVDRIAHVYSGKLGCACGCRGKHTYASKHAEWGSKHRGYTVSSDEISDRSVKIIFKKVMNAPRNEIIIEDMHVAWKTSERMYVLYLADVT